MSNGSLTAFAIVAFCFALVLILKKDSIQPPFRKYMAMAALFFVASAFIMIVYSLFNLGK